MECLFYWISAGTVFSDDGHFEYAQYYVRRKIFDDVNRSSRDQGGLAGICFSERQVLFESPTSQDIGEAMLVFYVSHTRALSTAAPATNGGLFPHCFRKLFRMARIQSPGSGKYVLRRICAASL